MSVVWCVVDPWPLDALGRSAHRPHGRGVRVGCQPQSLGSLTQIASKTASVPSVTTTTTSSTTEKTPTTSTPRADATATASP